MTKSIKSPLNKDKVFEKWALPKLYKIQKILLLEHFAPLDLEPSETEASECQFNYPYQTITIRYSKSVLSDFYNKNYQRVIGVLIHEMSHCLTDALYAKATTQWTSRSEIEDEREKLTDHIANIVLKANLIR